MGLTYCGYESSDSPHAQYVDHTFYNSDIRFFSSYVNADSGFAICMLDDPPPSATPTPAPTPEGCDAAAFSIDSGDCTVCGACFHTPNYLSGGDYDHSASCTITPLQDGYLSVLDFHIEGYFDDITVDGVEYDDNTGGPQGVAITTSSTISFFSDSSISYDGAYICLSDNLPPSPAPTAEQFDWDCTNSANGAMNGYGDSCSFYSTYGSFYCTYTSWWSGEVYYDDDDFTAVDMCCACNAPTQSPTAPAPTITCDTATAFSIDSGDCTACGACFHTPNYLTGGDYDHYHSCTITVQQSGWLDVLDFQIEGYFDDITVDGTQYDGYGIAQGPQGVAVTTSSSISFYSDYSIAYAGAYICLDTTRQPSPSPTVTLKPTTESERVLCDTPTHFSVASGGCHACGNCFYSPNYLTGGEYGNYHDCTINVLQSGYLDVLDFDLEATSFTYYGCR